MKYGDFEGPAEELIGRKLKEIEARERVRILYAAESGSRAWGFASPDSDYDVRFIYIRPMKHYLELQESRDVIEGAMDAILDINGWDLSKALRHVHKSNATLFEWANSPVVYTAAPQWKEIWESAKAYFSCKAAMYHYYGTARKNYARYLTGERVSYKKYFYALRPLLACKWIAEKACPPPVPFARLAGTVLEEDMRECVDRLLQAKQKMPESEQGERIEVLHTYLEEQISRARKTAEEMTDDRNQDWEALNRVFMHTLES